MKTKNLILAIVLYSTISFPPFGGKGVCQNIAINATGSAANASAGLDIDFNNKGLLIPRLTTTERNAISSPAQSLMIYNTTTKCFEFWENGLWQTMVCACSLPDAAGTISGTATVCQSQNGVAFSVGAISGATSYTWSYTGTGFGIATGSGTNSITANFSGAATSGNLTVYGTNSCGNGTVSANYAIAVTTPNGTACSSDATCCSGICGTNADGDGYFSQALGHTGTCQASSLPYTDCYDANANAYPGQTTYYGSHRGDGSFDYNCDGSTTKQYGAATQPGSGCYTCSDNGYHGPITSANCGVSFSSSENWSACHVYSSSDCTTGNHTDYAGGAYDNNANCNASCSGGGSIQYYTNVINASAIQQKCR